jgi:type I restriction enzyme S subunit
MGSRVVKLGELLDLLTDYHANGAYEKLKENVVLLDKRNYAAMIRTTNFEQNNFDTTLKYIDEHAYNFLKKSKVYAGDLIMNKIANAGSCYLMPDLEMPVSLAMNLFLLRVNKEKANPSYVYLYLKLNESYVKSFANGSVTKTITKDAVRNLEIILPVRNIQDAIADIYSAYTSKIQLNRQTNQTLEQMAQALFKSWFVDFDPVIDNALAAGKPIPEELQARAQRRQQQLAKPDHQPLPDEVRQLFPREFEETEALGWVPKGWEIEALDKVAHYQNGLALQKFRPENEDEYLPVLKIAQLKQGYADGKERASSNIKASCIVDDGDVIFSWSGSLMVDIWCGSKAALNQHLFKVTSNDYPRWFYYWYTKHHLIEFQRIAADKAVTMGHIKREHLSQAKCCIPPPKIFDVIGARMNSLLEKQVLVRQEVKSLEKLRDTLLPKLISGELRLPESLLDSETNPPESAYE